MAVTNKIKVNNVRVGDPNLTVTLASDDGGTFPRYVQILATLTNSNLPEGQLQVRGQTGPGSGLTNVSIQCSFPDSSYAPGQRFGYNITNVNVSNDGTNWSPFSGTLATDGDPWSGSVTSETFMAADATVAGTMPRQEKTSASPSFWSNIVAFFRRLFG
jgi:hypothetical protein